jgi:hypothetical protein
MSAFLSAEKFMAQRLIFLILFFSGASWSQTANHSWEGYAQASLTKTESILGDSATGFRVGTVWKPDPAFGLVADFASQSGSGIGKSTYATFMGGPRFYSAENFHLSGFLQALGGAYRASKISQLQKSTQWGYIVGGGAGFDIRLVDHLALRPLEYDLMFLGSGSGVTLVPRVSSGLVLRFGR